MTEPVTRSQRVDSYVVPQVIVCLSHASWHICELSLFDADMNPLPPIRDLDALDALEAHCEHCEHVGGVAVPFLSSTTRPRRAQQQRCALEHGLQRLHETWHSRRKSSGFGP
jgi:hypothetical protein